ncbi:MAG: acetylornithine/succinylornithine family transaminase [Gemmatimonadales bacterium]|nr:MAG: acetylornithine/succinylornithine family transaminase [Gemmatimonadales bacterium]
MATLNKAHQARAHLLGVYAPTPHLFVRGEGTWLVDDTGRRFLDFTSGIAVTALGHGHPAVRRALEEAAESGLIHTSNLFRTHPAEALARELAEHSGLDRVFFCNSGGEAVEASLKFARRWARRGGDNPERFGVVALKDAFHGRLFGSLAVTDRPRYREPFEPLMPGAVFVDPADPAALEAVDPSTIAALIAEPIQGEGGVQPLPDEVLRRFREWTTRHGVALIFDEIQCGLGRTGTLLAHESSGVRPDILTLAKPLAGGLPMGAVLMTEEVAASVQPGDHGTTFGGGPLVAAVARAVLAEIAAPDFLAEVRRKGDLVTGLLEEIQARHPGRILEIRGRGLMRGVRLSTPIAPVVAAAQEAGLLLVGAGPDVIRLLPPLTISDQELAQAMELLEGALEATSTPQEVTS